MTDTTNKTDTTSTLEVVKQPKTSIKRVREEGGYTVETTTETKFKIIYNKRLKLNSVDKEKVTIDVDETDDPVTNDDIATTIINETLVEIEKETTANQNDTQLIKKQHNMEASSSQSAEEKDLDIMEKYKQIKQNNE